MVHKFLPLPLLLAFLSACCATPLPEADFSSPEATLGTFQGAFNSDEAGADELGYACFAKEFKEQNGHFDLEMYSMVRRQALEANPFLSLLISLKDLQSCIENVDFGFEGDRDLALMSLSISSYEVDLKFRRETVCQLEYRSTTDKEKHIAPIEEAIQVEEDAFSIRVDGIYKSWIANLPSLRRIVIEERWKFAGIEILEYGSQTPKSEPIE